MKNIHVNGNTLGDRRLIIAIAFVNHAVRAIAGSKNTGAVMRVPGGPLLPGHVDRVFPDQVQAVSIIFKAGDSAPVGAAVIVVHSGHQLGVVVKILGDADDIPLHLIELGADRFRAIRARAVSVDRNSQNLLRQTVHIHRRRSKGSAFALVVQSIGDGGQKGER